MSNEPISRSQFKIKLKELAERHKVDLKVESFSEELFDIVVLERSKARISFSDRSDGAWNPQSEHPRPPSHD